MTLEDRAWLGAVHIQAFANITRHPIILYFGRSAKIDQVSASCIMLADTRRRNGRKQSGHSHICYQLPLPQNLYCNTYLPLMHPPMSEVPYVLAWQNEHASHFTNVVADNPGGVAWPLPPVYRGKIDGSQLGLERARPYFQNGWMPQLQMAVRILGHNSEGNPVVV